MRDSLDVVAALSGLPTAASSACRLVAAMPASTACSLRGSLALSRHQRMLPPHLLNRSLSRVGLTAGKSGSALSNSSSAHGGMIFSVDRLRNSCSAHIVQIELCLTGSPPARLPGSTRWLHTEQSILAANTSSKS